MKKHLLLCFLLAIIACDATDPLYDPYPAQLTGTWQLTEVLADPGDGSGTYRPVDSDKSIVFFEDGRFEANQNMCAAGDSDDLRNTGTYSLADATLTVTNCHFGASEEALKLHFTIDEGALYISYPCIEPCGEKYVRISNNND